MTLPAASFDNTVRAHTAADRGVSPEAKQLRDHIARVLEFPGSPRVGDARQAILEDVARLARGDVAHPTSAYGPLLVATVEQAMKFAELLPSTVPLPEVSLDFDGEISFDWDRGPRRVFAVSVGPDGTLSYAGLFDHNRVHGTEQMVGEIPASVQFQLRRVFCETVT